MTPSDLAPGGLVMQEKFITKAWSEQGISLHEVGDHVLELWYQGQLLARYSQTGATVGNIVRVIKAKLGEN